jgi:negative regulator of flagellin synthesis FlgM
VSSKIGGVDGNSPSTAIGAGRAVQRPQDAATGGAQNSQGSGGGSSVQITGVARQLASLEQALHDLPAVNDARVAQISNAIEQGTYRVDARHIANQLIQTEKELPNGSRSDADPEPDTD